MIMCDCISRQPRDDFDSFRNLRLHCDALKNVFIPDDHWENYKNFCLSDYDEAWHRPQMWLAYQGGYLTNLTTPIHQFILEGKQETKTVTPQYQKDLVERWFLKEDYIKRYKNFRIFQGRLAELRFASWLQQNGWQISSLEAYGGNFDVEAKSPEGAQIIFEVKHLAIEESRFQLRVQALRNGGVSYGRPGVYSPMDYLLCRTYEATHKLNEAVSTRIAVIILADYSTFELQLNDGWIKWGSPSLFQREQDIQPFLDNFLERYPNFEQDVGEKIKSLDRIWIFQDTGTPENLGMEQKFCIDPKVTNGAI